ncbi:MAG TPA: mitomycin resistance protein [Janthinobacterium sp.]|nr:mitomycin resistance protein [Janthinobacterium sp.]
MHPDKVERSRVKLLTDLPNIGKAGAADLRVLGIESPQQLIGLNPFHMYRMLCEKTKARHDPCVIDVFMSVVDFANGGQARPWWDYTEERKRALAAPG